MAQRFLRAWKKLMDAEYQLAVGEGDVRQRLRRAYTILRRLQADELSAESREEWRAILSEMTRLGPERLRDGTVLNTAIDDTMSRIRNTTGRKIAERIYRLYAEFKWMESRNRY